MSKFFIMPPFIVFYIHIISLLADFDNNKYAKSS
nr:MAG TPA: hypothetical protein [Caudoviricetes sp.]